MADGPTTGWAFDAEALVAFFAGEAGAEQTRDALTSVAEERCAGFLNEVNAAEVWYVLRRHFGPEVADDHLAWLLDEARLKPVSSSDTWRRAASIKASHSLRLGDAFALATGALHGCRVLTGNDPKFDVASTLGIEVHRIREAR